MSHGTNVKPALLKKLHLKREVLVRSGLRAGGEGMHSANSDGTMGHQSSGVILQPDAPAAGGDVGSPVSSSPVQGSIKAHSFVLTWQP